MRPSGYQAQRITTELNWDDLVLHSDTLSKIHEIEEWVINSESLMGSFGVNSKLKSGYQALFYGPSGTGKTLTATLLGKYTGKELYKIDLSMVVSKYIGETEKNLDKIFSQAENQNWILFFDEADALFGKRTEVKDTHDRYANQEISYLLQRMESYDGIFILASNSKENIDEVFIRRLHAIVHFPKPNPTERKRLWEKAITNNIELDNEVNLKDIAVKYKLTGSNIINIIRSTSQQVVERKASTISQNLLEQNIQREMNKKKKKE